MYLSTSGRGPDVVILPGLPQHPEDMQVLAEPLRDAHRVSIVHLPGYGQTPPVSDYDISAVGASLIQDLAAADITAPVLVGFSGGSYRALQIALEHRGLALRGLALLAPIASLDEATRESLPGFAQALAASIDLTEVGVQRFFSESYASAHPEQVHALAKAMLESVDREGVVAEFEAFAASEDLLPRLGKVGVSTLLRVGDLDLATPLEGVREIQSAIEGAHLDVVAGAGHMLHHEDLDGTLGALRDFLGSLAA